jgi:predicted metalloprotease with PDZ domain
MPRLRPVLFSALVLPAASLVQAQSPLQHWTDAIELRYALSQPVLTYSLQVDSADLSGYTVELRIRNAPDTVRLAMVAHPEYDDRYWRYVEGLEASGPRGAVAARVDSALWRVVAPGGQSTVRYRIHLPPPGTPPRAAWRPFLSPAGGMVGGAHSFMYVVGATLAPAHVILDLPAGWAIATGLPPTPDPSTFFAPSAFVLTDSPILVGRLRSWSYREDGVPHRVAYWMGPDAVPFDTAALVDGLARLTHEAVGLFGRPPYADYTFQLQDLAFGALEHLNSVSLGVPSDRLARDPTGFFAEAAHEYVHTWNLMRLRPAEAGDVDYRPPPRSRGLWWSEGITMYYADLLLRRAGLPTFEPTRVAHLESLIARYLASPGHSRFSPESVSVVTYGSLPGALGDYSASVHLMGELVGTLIDFQVRYQTDGHRTLDDVVRVLLARYSGRRGFTTTGVERAVGEVCACRAGTRRFFDRYVRHANPLDFDRYLALAGLRANVTWARAVDDAGHPVPDLRVFAWDPSDGPPSLLINHPAGVWGKAGLHTGDRILSVNGVRPADASGFREIRNQLAVGDTVRMELTHGARARTIRFVMAGYDRPVVRIEEATGAGERERRVREGWVRGEGR